jgi:hypothetical protein
VNFIRTPYRIFGILMLAALFLGVSLQTMAIDLSAAETVELLERAASGQICPGQ